MEKIINRTNKYEYKTVKEILEMGCTQKRYYKSAKILQSLALTQFAKEIENKGAKILSCSPVNIKFNGEWDLTIGTYLKYTYDGHYIYYIQFDENPFFPQQGYREYYTDKHRVSTGLTEFDFIWDGVNEYSSEDKYINKLTENLHKCEEYLKSLSMPCKDKYVPYRDTIEQKIYIY